MDSDRRVLSSKSPATKYEVMLLEDITSRTKGPCEERVALCFSVFDEVLPHLGVYRKIISIIREELYTAVYSLDYTTLPPKKGLNKTPVVQRVPFFVLVNRLYAERDKRAKTLQEQIQKLEKDVKDKSEDLEKSHADIEDFKHRVKTLEDEVFHLRMDLENCTLEKMKLEANLDQERRSHEASKARYEKRLASLREQLAKSEDMVKMLRKYKDGYDDLEEAFNDNSVFVKRPHNPAALTKTAQVIQEITSAKLLEEQLLTVQNSIIEEFDSFIEENKSDPQDEPRVRKGSRWDEETEDMKKFLKLQQETEERFKKSIADIENELQLIEIQRSTLEDRLENLQEEKGEEKKVEKRGAAKTNKDDEEIDFVKIMSTPGHADPFIPHERIMSKYAAMMYYSCNHGKNFHEFKDAKFCPSCGETTLLCPHKVVGEKLILLPHNCTHIKIKRPVVHILKDEMAELSLPGTPDIMRTLSAGTITPSYGEEYVVKTQQHLTTSYKRLWDDLAARTSIKRRIPRPLDKGRVLSIICQFYATLLWQDDFAMEDEQIVSVLDTLNAFFQERYLIPDVAYLAMHDFFSGVVQYTQENQSIQLFAQAMCGNLDPVVIRYVLLVNDIIDLVDWVAVSDIRVLAQIVYPFMHEEDLEQFTMGYTSFSENKISKELVSEYILYIILKYREPCFQDCEVKLLQHPGNRPGFMTDIEFTEAIDNICPLASERLRRRLFAESLEHMQDVDDSVNIMRLSQITGYLKLVQISPVVKDDIAQKVEEARGKTEEDENDPNEKVSNIKKQLLMEESKSKVAATGKKILTIEYVRSVAAQNSKRVTARQIKRVENYSY